MNYGRYQIIDEIGRGSTGIVYRALDPDIDRHVALKVLGKDKIGDTQFEHRFFKEAKVFGKLSHPNIVMIHDIGRDQGTIFIAMELIEGKPIDKYFSDNKIELNQLLQIGAQVASALHYAHEKGIVHRDIKPSNILLTADRWVKLTDFGVARMEDGSEKFQTTAGDIIGTPVYMSPEQIKSEPLDGRCDLFSLGVILYEYACGCLPFTGKNLPGLFLAIAEKKPKPPHQVNTKISVEFSAIILKTLAKNPSKRFQSGQEMAEALRQQWLWETQPKPSTKSFGKIYKASVPLCSALLLSFGLAGIFLYHYSPSKQTALLRSTSLEIAALPLLPPTAMAPSPEPPPLISMLSPAPIKPSPPAFKPDSAISLNSWTKAFNSLEQELAALEKRYAGVAPSLSKLPDRVQAVNAIASALEKMKHHIDDYPGPERNRLEILASFQKRASAWSSAKAGLETKALWLAKYQTAKNQLEPAQAAYTNVGNQAPADSKHRLSALDKILSIISQLHQILSEYPGDSTEISYLVSEWKKSQAHYLQAQQTIIAQQETLAQEALWRNEYERIKTQAQQYVKDYQATEPDRHDDLLAQTQNINDTLKKIERWLLTYPGKKTDIVLFQDQLNTEKSKWHKIEQGIKKEIVWRQSFVQLQASLQRLEKQYPPSADVQSRLSLVRKIIDQYAAMESLLSAKTDASPGSSTFQTTIIQKKDHWSNTEKELRQEIFQAEYNRQQKEIQAEIKRYQKMIKPEHHEQKVMVIAEIIKRIDASQKILESSPLAEPEKNAKSAELAELKQEWALEMASLAKKPPDHSYQRIQDSLGLDDI